MPRDWARVKLQALEVRQERLHQIDRASAIAEGMHSTRAVRSLWPDRNLNNAAAFDAVGLFATVWRKINDVESWNRNPWVWVLRFKVLS